MSARLGRLGPALLLSLACGGPPGAGGSPGKQEGPEPDRRVLVEVAAAEPGDVADHLEATGAIESEAQADLTPEATGVVKQIFVEEGDQVLAGQVLAVISNASLAAGADRAGIELDRARASLADAERLFAQGAVSEQDVRNARLALRTAESVYAEASTSRGYTRITSPIAGTVAVRDLRVGEVAGPRRAFQVVDMGRLRVIVRLPEKDLSRIREGLAVQLAGAYDENARATGKVLRVSPVVDAGTGTVRITVAVDPGQTALRPGQFVKVRVEVDRHSGVLTIPRRALDWEDGEPVAWTVVEAKKKEEKGEAGDGGEEGEDEEGEGKEGGAAEEPGLLERIFGGEEKEEGAEPARDPWEGIPRREAKRLPLQIGYQDPDRVEVTKGLEAGEQVVVLGHNNLREGSPVRLPDDPMPALEEANPGEDKP